MRNNHHIPKDWFWFTIIVPFSASMKVELWLRKRGWL